MPLDFTYDADTDSFDLSQFETDQDLKNKIQQGTSAKEIFNIKNGIIIIKDMFGVYEPENLYQNQVTGANRIQSASSAKFGIYITPLEEEPYYDKEW